MMHFEAGSSGEHIEHTLEPIAGHHGLLAQAVHTLGLIEPRVGHRQLSERKEELSTLLGSGVIDQIAKITGLRRNEVVDHVVDQLVSVAEFAVADGRNTSTVRENLVAVERLIQSGRGQLFSGRK